MRGSAPSRPYRVRSVDDLDDVLDVDVVLLGVQSHGEAVVLPAVHRLVAHRHHLPVHVQHLRDTPTTQVSLRELTGPAHNAGLTESTQTGPAPHPYLEGLPLQPHDDPHGLRVQLDQLAPLVLPPRVHAGRRLRAELQVPGQNLQLQRRHQVMYR